MMPVRTIATDHALSGLLEGLTAETIRQDLAVSGLALDSRKVKSGDLFLAVAGSTVHGLEFARQAVALGAVAVAWQPVDGQTSLAEAAALLPVPAIAVPDLGLVVGQIADRFYGHPSHGLFVIAVTGTDGKTSCSHFIAQALDRPDRRCGLIGTLGCGFYGELSPTTHTTPDALTVQQNLFAMQQANARCVVAEVSSHAMDQGRVRSVDIDIALLTNLSRDHLDYHGDLESYAAAKRKLFHTEGLRYAVINADDKFGSALLDDVPPGVAPVAYRLENDPYRTRFPAQWVVGKNLRCDLDGIRMDISTPWGGGELHATLLGRFNASNLLAALACVCVSGLPFDEAMQRLAQTHTVPGRMERFDAGDDRPLTVVDYAHTPGALEAVLQSLRDHCTGKIWCVFGAGGDRDIGKRALMGAVVERHADAIVLTDDNPRTEDPGKIVADILSGMKRPESTTVEHLRGEAINHAMNAASGGDIVLIAGKGHETHQIIGDKTLPFSDREQVLSVQRGWSK